MTCHLLPILLLSLALPGLAAAQQDFSAVEVEATPLRDGLYLVTLREDVEHPFPPETDEVEVNIVQVREASLATGAAASQVLGSADALESQASVLRSQVDQFLQKVRAA